MPKCKRRINDAHKWATLKATAAELQPRLPSNTPNRLPLPHSTPHRQSFSFLFTILPLDCRLLIWDLVLSSPYTRIERWRPFYEGPSAWARGDRDLDSNCFPYRLCTAGLEDEKSEKPLSALLVCRQMYIEALKILYSTTTFTFAMPADLSCFQVLASPQGLGHVRSVVLAFGRVDWRGNGPIYDYDGEALRDWEEAFTGLGKREGLRHLEVWLSHRNDMKLEEARRPREGCQDEGAEERHQKLFEVMGSVKVPNFTVRLTWNPVDVLEQKDWPFRVELQTADEMSREKAKLPEPTRMELSD